MNNHYLQSLLGESERILLAARQHWFVLASAIALEVFVALVVLVASIVAFVNFPLAGFASLLMLVPLASLIHDLLVWNNRQYIVTNRRVIQLSGVVNKSVVDSSLEKVNDVKMTQSFFGRLFDYGDIEIMTASELGVNLFKRIGDPVKFKTAMLNAKEGMGYAEDGHRAQPQAQPREDIPALIARLDDLRQKGILSEAEFQNKKKELLAKL
jgi:uncharacterized membrane protein YdbT with pleckstrin-like domain